MDLPLACRTDPKGPQGALEQAALLGVAATPRPTRARLTLLGQLFNSPTHGAGVEPKVAGTAVKMPRSRMQDESRACPCCDGQAANESGRTRAGHASTKGHGKDLGTRTFPQIKRLKRDEESLDRSNGRSSYYPKSDLKGIDSDYLCLSCYDPLYVNRDTLSEACFNRECVVYTDKGEFSGNIGDHGGPVFAREQCNKNIRAFSKLQRKFLFKKLYKKRAAECAKLRQRDGVNIDIIAAVDYLLTQVRYITAWGTSKSDYGFRHTFDTYFDSFKRLQLVGELTSKNYITNGKAEAYVIKYEYAINEFHKDLGIVDESKKHDRSDRHSFWFIDKKSMNTPVETRFDFKSIYDNSLPLIRSLNHAFKMGHTASKIHAYPARSEDFNALLSVWKTCPPSGTGTLRAEMLRKIYRRASRRNETHGHYDKFLDDYTSGLKYAPILIHNDGVYWFDYDTLLLYLVYLYSNNTHLSGTQAETGQTSYNKKRQAASRDFESEIRHNLRMRGFVVHPEQDDGMLRISFDNEHKEFDCMAVDLATKTVILVEAKYEDMAPSSKAGTKIVDQLLLDKRRGLLEHVKKQHSRLEFFRKNFHNMQKFGFGRNAVFEDYNVRTFVVTKYEPIISLYMGVEVLSYKQFKSIDLMSSSEKGHSPGPARPHENSNPFSASDGRQHYSPHGAGSVARLAGPSSASPCTSTRPVQSASGGRTQSSCCAGR